MKLNSIKLEVSVITDLYRRNLVEGKNPDVIQKTGIPDPAFPEKNTRQVTFLGENKKNILIIVNYNDVNFIPDEELTFLTSMLSACKLSLADVAIINLDKVAKPSFQYLSGELKSNIILLLGTTPAALELPLDFPHFQVQSFNNCIFLYTPFLSEIKNDKILKSKLWVCLQKIFNL